MTACVMQRLYSAQTMLLKRKDVLTRDVPCFGFYFIAASRQDGGGVKIQSGKQLARLASLH